MRNKILGFTLVELLVAISIIAVLSAVGIAVFRGSTIKAQDTKRKADIDSISNVLEMKYDPGDGTYLFSSLTDGDFSSGVKPKDPTTGEDYQITMGENNKSFIVCTTLSTNSNYCRSSSFGPAIPTPTGSLSVSSTPTPTDAPQVPTSTPTSVPPTPTPPSYKLVFVTSSVQTGNLGGRSGANSICQNLADTAGIGNTVGKTYKAWLSDSTGTAASTFSQSAVPYQLKNGTVIANNWADLIDGSLVNPINMDQNGVVYPYPYAWTGTSSNGTAVSYTHCTDWTTNSSGFGYAGNGSSITQTWTFFTGWGCEQSYRLYCFEQ